MRIGYFLSCEEYTPAELVEQANAAADAGFKGLVLAFPFTGEVLGLDVDVVGWFLMTVGVFVVAAATIGRLRRSDKWTASQRH